MCAMLIVFIAKFLQHSVLRATMAARHWLCFEKRWRHALCRHACGHPFIRRRSYCTHCAVLSVQWAPEPGNVWSASRNMYARYASFFCRFLTTSVIDLWPLWLKISNWLLLRLGRHKFWFLSFFLFTLIGRVRKANGLTGKIRKRLIWMAIL